LIIENLVDLNSFTIPLILVDYFLPRRYLSIIYSYNFNDHFLNRTQRHHGHVKKVVKISIEFRLKLIVRLSCV